MNIKIFKDYDTLSQQVADEIISCVKRKPETVLCLAAGDTPRLTYSLVVEKARAQRIDFKRCTFVGLDEWVGVPPDNEGSCFFFLNNNLFEPLNISSDQIHLFDALSKDLDRECQKMDLLIERKGRIDLMLVGVGMNGHIGFNEPGVSERLYAHVVPLDLTTQTVGQKYFNKTMELHYGITLGLKHLFESSIAILMASGKKKADVIRSAMEGPVSSEMPASMIRKHPNGYVWIDEDAASLLK